MNPIIITDREFKSGSIVIDSSSWIQKIFPPQLYPSEHSYVESIRERKIDKNVPFSKFLKMRYEGKI